MRSKKITLRTSFTAVLLMMFLSCSISVFSQSPEKENGPGISERAAFELERVKDPKLGRIPVNAHWQALMETKQASEFYSNTTARASALSWVERGPNSDAIGPSNGNTRPNNGVTSGRIRAILVDAADATGKTVWIGGVDGGLWKTTDITVNPANWSVVNDYLSNLAIADICQDPTNSNIMYFCTGESYYNSDAVAGVGVFKSTDHGATWGLLSSTTLYTQCTRILCDYLGNVYLGTRGYGLLRSTNGGTTWTTITPSVMAADICDMEISSTTAAGRLHVVSGIFSTQMYRFTDAPETVSPTSGWTAPTTAFPSYSMRAEIACSGNVLFAAPANSSYQVPTIYKSTDGGANWSAVASQPGSGTWANGQGWYALGVAIDPSNSNNCIVGGLDAYLTTNGGTSWTKISSWYGTTGQYVHADIHDIVWYDSGNKLLFACDGGIHYSADKGSTIRDRNTGLRLKQFYSVAIHPSTTNYFLAGAQDNGNHQLTSSGLGSSIEVVGGDGAFVAIDQDQPQYQFCAYVYNQYRRSTDGGNSWSTINFSGSAGQFINPFDYDNTNNKLYAAHNAGYYLRWDDPQTGSTSSTLAISAFNGAKVSNVKVSPFTSNRVYFGTAGGRVVRVDNANTASPTATNLTSASMAGYVSCINVGTSDQYLIACFSNYGVMNVWVSTDGGTTWTGVDGNLPNMPVRWCMFEPNDNSRAIIATETGVWETSLLDGANTAWIPSLNFPSVRTDMLAFRSSDGTLAAATHGRGIFTTVVSGSVTCNNPAGLTTTSISSSSAVVSWTPVTGAQSYDVDYHVNGDTSWTNAATGTANTSVSLTGLSASTLYEWRVVTNCSGGSSNYSSAQFTTSAPFTCNPPSGLASTGITGTTAIISWGAVSGALNYTVQYKKAVDTSWTTAAASTTSTTITLSGLTPLTTYNYQVRTNCNGSASSFASAQFSTTAQCPGIYDVSSINNNNTSGAPLVPTNTDINGTISTTTDADYYKFTINTAGTATLVLSNLPYNYDMKLYATNGKTTLVTAAKTGTTNDSISWNFTSSGTYYVKIYGVNKVYSTSQCYKFKVILGTATTQDVLIPMNNENTLVKLYPNPAGSSLNISTDRFIDDQSALRIFNVTGVEVISQKFTSNPQSLDISSLTPGIYFIKVKTSYEEAIYKFIKK